MYICTWMLANDLKSTLDKVVNGLVPAGNNKKNVKGYITGPFCGESTSICLVDSFYKRPVMQNGESPWILTPFTCSLYQPTSAPISIVFAHAIC